MALTTVTPFESAPFNIAAYRGQKERYSVGIHITDAAREALARGEKPVIQVFFHGFKATLADDVMGYKAGERWIPGRQKLTEKADNSKRPVIVLAPQLAYKDSDPSPGKFANPGSMEKFMEEAAQKAAAMSGYDADVFRKLPIEITAYSGGGATATAVIKQANENPSLKNRIAHVNLLDSLWEGVQTYVDFIKNSKATLRSEYISGHYIDKKGRRVDYGVTTSKLNKALKSEIPASARDRVSVEQVQGPHITMIEGDDKREGAFSRVLARSQNYPKEGLTQLASVQPNLSPPSAAGHTQTASAAPQSQSYTSRFGSWAFSFLPKRLQNYMYPPAEEKKVAVAAAPPRALPPAAAPPKTAGKKPPEKPATKNSKLVMKN